MKKMLLILAVMAAFVCMLAFSANAAAPVPQKPQLDVDFGDVTIIDGFTAPSELFVGTTQRVLLTDGEGNYVTYPTYYVTKNNTTFDFDFSKLNAAQSIQYSKKSVVMVEIPTGITTISNSYFAGTGNFPLCVSVQIPGTVTSFGSSLFSTNSVIRIVECLDGTEPVTIGDAMFGSAWNGGANMIGYVRFPNNLVSIGNNTFGKTKGSSKVIILGANLKKIGTGFFGEGTPESTDTFLYVSDNFFSEDEVFANLFGSFGQYHDNHLKLTIFYTGSQTQLQSLIDRGLTVQDKNYLWNNPTVVSASEYDYETHKPKSRLTATFVYDYNECDAFYGGHTMAGKITAKVTDYFNNIEFCDACLKCGSADSIVDTVAPLFTWKGYSVSTFGEAHSMTQGYGINWEAIEAYKKYVPSFEFGLIAAGNASGKEFAPKLEGDLCIPQNKIAHDYFDIKINGITEEYVNSVIVFCAYVKAGDTVYYLDNNTTAKAVTGISYSEIIKNS